MCSLLVHTLAEAEEKPVEFMLSPADRLLIVAPHPDDDIIGTGGLIQQAVRNNIPVKIVYLTNGDSNSLAFLYYKKRPILSRSGALKMGELRQTEAGQAAGHLGLKTEDLVFLGYPDFGTLNMIKKYWQAPRPFRSILTRVTQVPYASSPSYQAPYRPENIFKDIRTLIKDFAPTKVFVTHPADRNPDHQAAFLFVQAALWSLQGEMAPPDLVTYLVHYTGWPRPLGLHTAELLQPPAPLRLGQPPWMVLELPDEDVTRKKEAVAFHRTQIPYKPQYLFTFVRANELFFHTVPVVLKPAQAPDEKSYIAQKRTKNGDFILKAVSYGADQERLFVRIHLGQKSLKNLRLDVYLFGFAKNQPFESMPKLNLKVNQELELTVLDGKKRLAHTRVDIHRLGSDVLITVPFKVLAMPDRMMTFVDLHVQNLPMQSTAWQILEVVHGQ
ncbi:MAG: PIG-L family deacetylase [Candidatus Omnitrophica bacterium]|nr:PIG-L family deacetylase [Candidatus Omnitrophota bacterium]